MSQREALPIGVQTFEKLRESDQHDVSKKQNPYGLNA
ncbi:hypothetical protein PEPS_44950 (plasmid) [Persicobacter psychrovividus]|uniref:Uncharacterized protein n=1 Tax=Persicobacter psychrovividus TaxID=387638 RepID=A0ABM7VMH9_9BACT|nr:hypothetical protein PEPS_44950 [Persicobacter psychrovividus]